MSDEAAFLTALKANPADDLTRLVYADWLDDRDESAKGQYLRAVVDLTRLSGGTAEYNDAAGRLYTVCPHTDDSWRWAAGSRFDVLLDGYGPKHKIHAIKVIREQTGFGLAESKALAESVPTVLAAWLRFEVALPRLLAFHWPDQSGQPAPLFASVRPSPWPDGAGRGAVFDVFLDAFNPDGRPWDDFRVNSAIRALAQLRGISEHDASEALQKVPLLLTTGLAPKDVADYVREVQRLCNVYRVLPPGAIRVVPRLPTA